MENRKAKYGLPDLFPEEDFIRDGPMRQEIITMAVEAAHKHGYEGVTKETIWSDPSHRELMVDYLSDCRPLPLILEMIKEFKSGAPASA